MQVRVQEDHVMLRTEGALRAGLTRDVSDPSIQPRRLASNKRGTEPSTRASSDAKTDRP